MTDAEQNGNELTPEQLNLAMYDYAPPCMAETDDEKPAQWIMHWVHAVDSDCALKDYSMPVCSTHRTMILNTVRLRRWNGIEHDLECDLCEEPLVFSGAKRIERQ